MLAGFTQLALTTAPVIALLVWLQRADRRRIEAGQSPGRHSPRRQPGARRRVAAGDPRRPSHTVARGATCTSRRRSATSGSWATSRPRCSRACRPLRHGHPLWRCGMNTRMLVVVFAGQEAAAIQGLPAAARHRPVRSPVGAAGVLSARSRLRGWIVTIGSSPTAIARWRASPRRRPPPYVTPAAARPRPVEIVVRFGAPGREVLRETDAFTPDLVAFFAPPALALVSRLRVALLRRRVARRQARLAPRRDTRRGSPSARGHAGAGPALTLAIAA